MTDGDFLMIDMYATLPRRGASQRNLSSAGPSSERSQGVPSAADGGGAPRQTVDVGFDLADGFATPGDFGSTARQVSAAKSVQRRISEAERRRTER